MRRRDEVMPIRVELLNALADARAGYREVVAEAMATPSPENQEDEGRARRRLLEAVDRLLEKGARSWTLADCRDGKECR